MQKFYLKEENGYALIIIFLILSLMGIIIMSLSIIIATKIKTSLATSDSMVSFYVAEAGTEKFLYEDRKNGYTPIIGGSFSGSLSNGASYSVSVINIDASTTTVKSIGSFNNVSRALEINYGN